jgi:hypothetical protein
MLQAGDNLRPHFVLELGVRIEHLNLIEPGQGLFIPALVSTKPAHSIGDIGLCLGWEPALVEIACILFNSLVDESHAQEFACKLAWHLRTNLRCRRLTREAYHAKHPETRTDDHCEKEDEAYPEKIEIPSDIGARTPYSAPCPENRSFDWHRYVPFPVMSLWPDQTHDDLQSFLPQPEEGKKGIDVGGMREQLHVINIHRSEEGL